MSELANIGPKFRPAIGGLAARKAAAAVANNEAETNEPAELKPDAMKDRIGIVFDDSGSMAGQRIVDAKLGVEEFLRSCAKDQTAIAIYPMNAAPLTLNTNLPAVAIYTKGIKVQGGTPLLQTLVSMKTDNPFLTRAIVFSDGAPDDSRFEAYGVHKDWGLVVDTVFIGQYGEEFMRKLAEITGGIFLKFDPAKSNFATAFKYLSPGLRYMLADKSFVAKLEGK